MHLRPWFVGTHLLLLSFAAFGWVTSPDRAPAKAQDPDEEPVKDGKWLYTRNCSGCHNDNGDGRGATILALGLTARDFKQGGFAFGDSREAITRTINTGIPGRSPMPPFKGTLTDDEIALVVGHVFTLMPPRKDERPKNTIMVVKDRPVIARGKLPPLVEDGKDIPRGLLIGTPEGMTFEYDISDVKLLGVRLGGFADREDWSDRGGGYLKPLGKLVWSSDNDVAPFVAVKYLDIGPSGSSTTTDPMVRSLEGTWIRSGDVGLTYAIQVSEIERFHCDETLRAEVLSIGPGFTRTWLFSPASTSHIAVPVAGSSNGRWRAAPHVGDPPARWWVRDRTDSSADAVLIRSSPAAWISHEALEAGRLDLEFAFNKSASSSPVRLIATYVTVAKWSPELGEKLAKELGQ